MIYIIENESDRTKFNEIELSGRDFISVEFPVLIFTKRIDDKVMEVHHTGVEELSGLIDWVNYVRTGKYSDPDVETNKLQG